MANLPSSIKKSLREITCVAYGDLANDIERFWSTTGKCIILCVLRSWKIVCNEGVYHKFTSTIAHFTIFFFAYSCMTFLQ